MSDATQLIYEHTMFSLWYDAHVDVDSIRNQAINIRNQASAFLTPCLRHMNKQHVIRHVH